MAPRLIACALLCAVGIGSARAADIRVIDVRPDGLAIIGVAGELVVDDGEKFAALAARHRRAAVIFSSPGGSVLAGIQMGQIIRLRRYATLSLEGTICASACALAWLAGTPRLMQPGSRIGFHAAYDRDTREQTGVGNALIGAYLTRLGLSYSAIVYIEQAGPDNLTWLTPSDARRVEISVTILPSSPGSKDARPVTAPDEGQKSRPIPRSFPAAIPSLVAPQEPSAPPPPLEEQVKNYAQDYFAHWSEANAEALGFFAAAYAPRVIFYGDTLERSIVLQKKRDYVARWPIRVYTVRAPSLRALCNPANRTCVVTGIVDWDCRDPSRNAHSTGAANFSLTISLAEGPRHILAESGSVISRNTN